MFLTVEDAANHLQKSLDFAESYKSKIGQDILDMEGMTGFKTRHFYNNLLDREEQTSYLEIGTWMGSSFISAMFKNLNTFGVGIDSFTDNWGGNSIKSKFYENCNQFLQHGETYQSLEIDWREFSKHEISKQRKFDVYLFDSSHEEEAQFDAFAMMHEFMADICIVVIDDWDIISVRDGTNRAKQHLSNNYDFLYEKMIQYTESGRQGSTKPKDVNKHPGLEDFWNGMYACVMVRKDRR